jgi:hypothetical protein
LEKCPQGIINSVGHLYVQGGSGGSCSSCRTAAATTPSLATP